MKKNNAVSKKTNLECGNGIPIMLIGSNKKEMSWVKEQLKSHGNGIFEIIGVPTWKESILELGTRKPELIVMYYHQDFLEDVDATARIHAFAPDVPILVIGRLISTEIELQAIHAGAQNYLRRDSLDGNALMREILYSFARQHRVNKVHVLREVIHRKDVKDNYKKNAKIEALNRLWSGITHDFNNIIGSIYGYAELAQELLENPSEHPESVKEHLGLVMSAAEKGRMLVEQIATLGSGKESGAPEFDVSMVTREAVQFLRSAIPSSIRISTNIDPAAGMLQGDVSGFFHIVVNLGLEACKHIREDKGDLRVALKMSEHCWLHGDGKRIPHHTCVTLQVHGETQKNNQDEAAVVSKNHVVVMPKKLAVFLRDMRVVVRKWESTGKGLTGEMCLPFSLVAESPEKAYPCHVGKGERLLLVEDDPNLSEAGRRMLERSGFQVKAFTDSRKALQSFLDDPTSYDLVITDYMMPDLSGKDMLDAINTARKDVPVILSTGYMANDIVRDPKQPMLRKPYKKKELLEAIRKALSRTHE